MAHRMKALKKLYQQQQQAVHNVGKREYVCVSVCVCSGMQFWRKFNSHFHLKVPNSPFSCLQRSQPRVDSANWSDQRIRIS